MFGLSFAQPILEDSLGGMLEQAKEYYNNGEYEYAISELEKALQYLNQLKQSDLVEAYKYLAFSYVAFGDQLKAKDQFRKALALDPQLELDPTTVSPKIIKVFEEAKSEMPPAPPPPPVEEPTKPAVAKKEVVSRLGATMRSCCLPGLGQMYKGQGSKGKIIMIASGLTFSTALISLIMREAAHQEYLDVEPGNIDEIDEKYKSFKLWHNASALTSAVFIGIYLYNIYDVLFTNGKIESSMINTDKGFYCEPSLDRIQIGYRMNF